MEERTMSYEKDKNTMSSEEQSPIVSRTQPQTPKMSGKQPLAKKPKYLSQFSEGDMFTDRFAINKSLKDKLKQLGLEVRFINRKRLEEVSGYHERGWKVFKRADFLENGEDALEGAGLGGTSPDGVIQIAHDVLAYRPIWMGDKHRADIAKRTKLQSGDKMKAAAEDLRETARRSGVKIKVLEGYEENE